MTAARPLKHWNVSRHSAAAVLAGGFLAAALAGITAAPAVAADGPAMQLSGDGIHFTSSQEPMIFPHLAGLVPGESRPGTVWVRNAGTEPAVLDLAVRSGSGSTILTNSLELLAGSPGHTTVTVPLADPGECRTALQGWALAPGQTLRLDLSLGLDLAAGDATRRETAGVELVFLMQATGGGTSVTACGTPGGPAARTSLRQVAGTGTIAVDPATGTSPPLATPAPATPAGKAAGKPAGVEHQAPAEPTTAVQSNVVGNDPRQGQLLLAIGGVFFFAALAKRKWIS